MVFIRFYVFDFFMILVSPEGPWDLILRGLGGTWDTILVILEVPGEVLKFQWILGYPLGHPWG